MAYDIQLKLSGAWISECDSFMDESGAEVTHFTANLPGKDESHPAGFVDIYVGDMPEGETAEDQAFANYAETVGFSEDDPEDFNPIFKVKFNGRNAWGFDALCEDDMPMRFLSQEVRSKVLAIIVFGAADESALGSLHQQVERGLRVR